MNCPKCGGDMTAEAYEGFAFLRCAGCQGMWFGAAELKALRDLKGAEGLDIGSHVVGNLMNNKDEIDCPKCQVRLAKKVDVDQHHIWYEQCPQCEGVFLDAGEFRDLRHYGLMCYLRGLFAKDRK